MVKHLPLSIKQLLTLRNPGAHASPSTSALNAVLHETRSEARKYGAEDGWLVLSTCTLLTANTPDAVGDLYRFATRTTPFVPDTRLRISKCIDIAAKMRESSLKSSIFVGVPRTIISLTAMTEAFEDDVKAGLRKKSRRMVNSENVDMFVERGRALWKSIYEPHDVKLYNKLGRLHPDFITFIIQAYGVVLSPFPAADQEQGNLSRALGSVVGTACLRAETRVGPQLTSHVFGLLKAHDIEGISDGDRWLSSEEGTRWVINSVDKIYDVARGTEAELAAKL